MGWDRNQPTNPKYKSREHRHERARWASQMKTIGYLICAQPICVMPDRIITNGEPWHLGHDDAGIRYIGPCHKRCNERDGAVRGRARQDAPTTWDL